MITVTLTALAMGLRAAFTLKDHIEGYGSLRTLIWLALALLPVTATVWVLAVLSASDTSEILFYAYSLCSVLQAVFILLGYCLLNRRVRRGLMRLGGKQAGPDDVAGGDGRSSTGPSHFDAAHATSRSSLAYQNNRGAGGGADMSAAMQQRILGISTSSTTSRSTCKTGSSSNYGRRGGHEASTSSASQSSYGGGGGRNQMMGRQTSSYDTDEGTVKRRPSETVSNGGGDSDGQRSLDLASSHSSDDDETITNRSLSLNRNLKGETPFLILKFL